VVQNFLAKRKGILEVDLRLRPYGEAGSLAVSLTSFRRHFGPDGDACDCERQALVKLRSVAVDAALGARLERLCEDLVYGEPWYGPGNVRAMRERQLRHLVEPGTLNAKSSHGGLVDVKYLAQAPQPMHGASHRAVRQTNTRLAIDAL